MRLGLTHSYARLPSRLYAALPPAPVPEPRLVVFNSPLAAELGLDVGAVERQAAALFSGNSPPEDAQPLAMAYAGHQFGHFVPSLGDGRAILLGELRAPNGRLLDLQLKGSGLTPFSRGGDGRAALGPMLREYLVSEAMHALGIATTRSLAVVSTGDSVHRARREPGAILTRVAASHVRVGTFQYLGARGDTEGLRALLDFVIERHYPDARQASNPALAVLQAVADRQASLLADWLRVGFIHGVMNTDNMAISGETIDYGPCAFLDAYHPDTVFSSIDRHGRYAYANQPTIAQWNLARFAEALLPLIDSDKSRAIEHAGEIIEAFLANCDRQVLQRLAVKTGLETTEAGDNVLIGQLLSDMTTASADFTLTFRRLADAAEDPTLAVPGIQSWLPAWHARLQREPRSGSQRAAAMRAVNPAFIPRNHRVEAALEAASQLSDLAPFLRLLEVLRRPYESQPDALEYERAPTPSERVLETFCGT